MYCKGEVQHVFRDLYKIKSSSLFKTDNYNITKSNNHYEGRASICEKSRRYWNCQLSDLNKVIKWKRYVTDITKKKKGERNIWSNTKDFLVMMHFTTTLSCVCLSVKKHLINGLRIHLERYCYMLESLDHDGSSSLYTKPLPWL